MLGRRNVLCAPDQEFLAVEDIEPNGSFPENGVIGLSPGKGQKSVLNTLKASEVIYDEIVAMDFEEEIITFGKIELP